MKAYEEKQKLQPSPSAMPLAPAPQPLTPELPPPLPEAAAPGDSDVRGRLLRRALQHRDANRRREVRRAARSVDLGDRRADRDAAPRGEGFQPPPERIFQGNAGAMAANRDRPFDEPRSGRRPAASSAPSALIGVRRFGAVEPMRVERALG